MIAPGQRQCLAASAMFTSAHPVSPHLLRGACQRHADTPGERAEPWSPSTVEISTLHSVENPLLDSSHGRNLVNGGDSDLVAELAEGSGQHLGPFLLFSGSYFVALLDKAHSFMQDLPNETT